MLMKKEVIVLLLLGILFVLPFVSAQEQAQAYSGFERFIDNTRMFFTFGNDGKVALSLEIKNKEVNSAIVNTKTENKEEAEKNLERAWEKLQFIQEKVSVNTAEEVKQNSERLRENIRTQENLPETFEVYALEEEKTGLTAEWVIESNGKEGQTLENEVIVNRSIEQQNRVVEIETKIDKIDMEISDWVVEHTYSEGTGPGGEAGVVVEGGLAKVVRSEVNNGDNGLKPEVKTYVAGDGTMKDEPLPKPDLNKINPDLYDPDARAPGDTIDETYDDESVNNGNCGDGVVCEGENNVIEGGQGTEGVNEEPSPAVDSNEGDSDSGMTGEAVKEIKPEDNFLARFFNRLFGR